MLPNFWYIKSKLVNIIVSTEQIISLMVYALMGVGGWLVVVQHFFYFLYFQHFSER